MERRRTRRVATLTGAVAVLVAGLLGVLPQAVSPVRAASGVDPYHPTTPVASGATGPVALSGDGSLLAVATGAAVRVLRTTDEAPVLTLPVGAAVTSIGFASATASAGTLVVGTAASVEFVSWATGSGGTVAETRDAVLGSSTAPAVPAASVAPISATRAYVLDTAGAVWLTDVTAADPTAWTATELVLPDTYRAIAYAAVAGHTPRLYAITDTAVQELGTTPGADGVLKTLTLNAAAASLAVSPDGQHLFIGESGQLAEMSTASWAQPTTTTLPAPVSSAYPSVPSTWAPAGHWTSLPTLAGSTDAQTVSCGTLAVSSDGARVYCTGTTSAGHGLYWFTTGGVTLSFGGAYEPASPVLSGAGIAQVVAASGARVYAPLSTGAVTSVPVATTLAKEAVPTGSRAGAPLGVVVSSAASTTVDVRWSAPVTDGGQPVLGYLVTATPSAGGPATYCSPGGTGTSCTLTGLATTTEYVVSVQAATILGPGSDSDAQRVTPGIPTAARNVALGTPVLSGTATRISVTWAAPASSGDTPIRGYLVCADAVATTGTQPTCGVSALPLGHTCSASSFVACPSPSGTSATLSGLDPKKTYLVTVTAYNDTSSGTTSTPISIVPGAPSAPGGLSARTFSQAITLSWQPPAYSGVVSSTTSTGTTVKSNASVTYSAFLEPGHLPCPGSAAAPMTPTTCTWTGLTNGVTYAGSVVAWAGSGASSSGTISTVTGLAGPAATIAGLQPATTPDAPDVTGLLTAPGQVTVTWAAPATDGGSPVTGYTASARSGGSARSCTTTSALSCTITGLTNGVSYGVTVTATNAQGAGTPSAGQVVTPSGPPSAVRGVRVAVSGTRASVAWSAPASTGSGAAIDYTVTATSAHDRRQCHSQGGTGCDLVGLHAGETYTVSVVATNADGFTSGASAAVRATALAAPATPSASVHKRRQHRQHRADVTVRWPAVAGATGYQVARAGGPLLAVKRSTAGTALTFTNLPKGRYRFTVTAYGLGGHGATSAVRSVRVR